MKKIKKTKLFIIDRKKWARGKENFRPNRFGRSSNYLFNIKDSDSHYKSGSMCCLGFYGKACGNSIKSMADQPSPESLGNNYFPGLINKNGDDNRICTNLITINDSIAISESKRESRIKELFKKIGVTVKFKN